MKKIGLMLAMVALSVGALMAKDKVSRDVNVLPAKAKSFIANVFSTKNVSHIKIDSKTFGGDEYDVVLTDGTEIEFNSKGEWTDVESGGNKGVASAFVLKPIAEYVKKHYSGQKIMQVSKERHGYDVELSSGTDLQFDSAGKFLRVDY